MKLPLVKLAIAALLWPASPSLAQTPQPVVSAVGEAPTEIPVRLGEGRWAVDAVITLPPGLRPGQRVPAVVLEHGFGPGTVDADVGPNKIFQQTANQLAARGIVVLRHAKRSTQHAGLFRAEQRHQTVAEEWTEDAAAGVRLLRGLPYVDPDRVYLVGHSASAGLMPRVALETGAAGAVLVSGSPRRPAALIRDQMAYLSSLDAAAGERSQGDANMATEVRLLEDVSASDDQQALGHPLWYWRSLMSFDPIADIRALRARGGRVFIIQGQRDYLVGEEDWRLWNEAFADDPGIARHLYVSLNHMMQPGEGRMTPAEYGWEAEVAREFTAPLAQWLQMDD